MGPGQRFQRTAALDQNAAPGGLGDAGDEGDGGGQDQRAGRGDNQHGEGAHRIARKNPGTARHEHGQR